MIDDYLDQDSPPSGPLLGRQHSFASLRDGSVYNGQNDTNAVTKMMEDLWVGGNNHRPVPSEKTTTYISTNVERLAAKELYEMNSAEREAIIEELHGVKSRAVAETPEMIGAALDAFEEEIQLLRMGRTTEMDRDINGIIHPIGKAYLRAVEVLHSNYVTAPEFRIRFLRAEFFHVEKAVRRYCKYLNHIWDLFGDVALVRQIELNDLNKDELKYLKGGQLQSLLSRDKMGRKIYVVLGYYDVPIMERVRVESYLAFAAHGDDETTQIYGSTYVVFLAVNENSILRHDRREWHANKKFLSCSPFRMTALHFCMPQGPVYNFLKTIATAAIRPEMRASTRFHFGSHLECNYALCQFGIPVDDIPKSITGNIKSKSIQKFIKSRMAIEEYRRKRCQLLGVRYVSKAMEDTLVAAASSPIPPLEESLNNQLERLNGFPPSCPGTDCPGPDCIVFGDRVTYKHSANVRFRDYLRGKRHYQEQLKEQERQQHGKEKRQKERIFSAEFLDNIIEEASGILECKFAFYDRDAGWYTYIEPDTVENRQNLRKKISQLMRDERKRERALISPSGLVPTPELTEKEVLHTDHVCTGASSTSGETSARIEEATIFITEQDRKRFKKLCEGCDFGGVHSCDL